MQLEHSSGKPSARSHPSRQARPDRCGAAPFAVATRITAVIHMHTSCTQHNSSEGGCRRVECDAQSIAAAAATAVVCTPVLPALTQHATEAAYVQDEEDDIRAMAERQREKSR